MFTEQEIKDRVKGLGKELKAAYGDGEFTIISIINGAVFFTADLMREIDNPVRLGLHPDFKLRSKDAVVRHAQVIHSLTLDISKRHVLLIDDILDTGKTIALVDGIIRKSSIRRACASASFSTSRGAARSPTRRISSDSRFRIDLSSGNGLDFAERYRNLPCIGVLKPELQKSARVGLTRRFHEARGIFGLAGVRRRPFLSGDTLRR